MSSIFQIIGFFIFLNVCYVAHSQTAAKYYGIKSYYGFIIAHTPDLKPISQTNPYGFQIEISKLKTSDKAWKTCFCYGRSGFALSYFNFANPDILGNAYNLSYFVEPYFTYKGPLKLSLRGTIGASYLDTVFDQETNPDNVLFSTNLSFLLGLSLNLNYHINDRYAINLSANYNHISNGGQKQPNKGMNFPMVSIGFDKIIDYTPLKPKPQELKQYSRDWSYYLGSFASLRSADREAESTNHPLIGVFGGGLKPLSAINGFNLGAELWYDWSDQKQVQQQSLDESSFSSAVTIGHHFLVGDFYFLQQFGVYLTRPKTIQPNWLYQRYSFWYRIAKKWTIGASMIAYGRRADHMDGRLIYMLK
ncbi:acyloxyacyl hydrolase [Aquimarina sp. U1-2]|uniref:acyloxyacyl hydrolase n=1 Tax=Aquimarina sp. U1-2 TaxID=2823141 RepID=UPI001AECF081|nr:acyloxyacyl hydrolase [Aquimarina sp. U1-2]MBP2832297.1 acyloxyacyl hydrolase [Aquimarina sp. U1-2]